MTPRVGGQYTAMVVVLRDHYFCHLIIRLCKSAPQATFVDALRDLFLVVDDECGKAMTMAGNVKDVRLQ